MKFASLFASEESYIPKIQYPDPIVDPPRYSEADHKSRLIHPQHTILSGITCDTTHCSTIHHDSLSISEKLSIKIYDLLIHPSADRLTLEPWTAKASLLIDALIVQREGGAV